MTIKELMINLNLKDKKMNPESCHWNKKFVKREHINKWIEGKGKCENKYVCMSGSCSRCQDSDSKFIIPLTKEQRKLNGV